MTSLKAIKQSRRVIQVEVEGERGSNPGSWQLFHFFNTFFFKKLTEKSGGRPNGAKELHIRNHERVRKWTKACSPFH